MCCSIVLIIRPKNNEPRTETAVGSMTVDKTEGRARTGERDARIIFNGPSDGTDRPINTVGGSAHVSPRTFRPYTP